MEQTQDARSWKYKIRYFWGECLRVLKVTKKPGAKEKVQRGTKRSGVSSKNIFRSYSL